MRDGKSTLFWPDAWLRNEPLNVLFPDLFKLCDQKDIMVADVLNNLDSITFRRWLTDDLRSWWELIIKESSDVQLGIDRDIISWKLESRGKFSVKSTYNAVTSCDYGHNYKYIWKGKISAKIKIFLWLVANNALLTKDNMIRRKWIGDPSCYFCQQPETVSHLLFACPVAKAVWAIFATCLCANNIPASFDHC